MRGFLATKDAPVDVKIPERKTKKSAGYDICTTERVVIKPHGFVIVKSCVKGKVNYNEFVMVVPRSSLFKKTRLIMPNSVGIIDADYFGNIDNDGNIGILLLNTSNKKVTLKKHEAIAQAIILKYGVIDNDKANGERVGGFGSTDQKENDNE